MWIQCQRHRGAAFQCIHEYFKVLHIASQTCGQLRQRLSICLADVKNLDRAEPGNFNFLFLGDDVSVLIQHRGLGVRGSFLLFDFLLKRCGSDNSDSVLTLVT